MIQVEQLAKDFYERGGGRVPAVRDVSFTCRPGEVYGLLGVNGAGKTTTLRMLATLLRPSGGRALVAGWDVERQPGEVRRHVGFLSTATALYGRLTGREMIEYFGRLHDLPETALQRRTAELVDALELGPFQHQRCDRMSTGQKQRISIARTLVHDPPVMIFDEPTNGLDVLAARAIVDFIRDCRTRGRTVLFSSHVMSEVARLCDRVGVVHAGRLVAEDTVAGLRARYGTEDLEAVFLRVVEEGA